MAEADTKVIVEAGGGHYDDPGSGWRRGRGRLHWKRWQWPCSVQPGQALVLIFNSTSNENFVFKLKFELNSKYSVTSYKSQKMFQHAFT